jgi:hypothetical protein
MALGLALTSPVGTKGATIGVWRWAGATAA